MMKQILLFSIAILFFSCISEKSGEEMIYCNPLDLDYGWGNFEEGRPSFRTSADPVVVLFKNRYYLFATHDIGGYRVSEDLMNWKNVFFNKEIQADALDNGSYVAPAVAADQNYLYFIKLNRNKEEKTTRILRSAGPESGKWEVCGEIRRVSDPTLFIDNGRYFIFHGLGTTQSIKCFELDPKTMTEIPGSEHLLLDYITDVRDCKSGYYFGRREIYDEIDAREWMGKFSWLPCPEGSWIVKNNGRYYLQFATPGTISIWYCDVVMVSSEPNQAFVEQPYNPVSLKAGGFIGSAGHSSVFKDKYGNWWQITTMWVGNQDPFERRLGLFPVSFDDQGRMKVHTLLGDYPMILPQKKFDADSAYLKGWWNLSYNKKCVSSSHVDSLPPDYASDENIRTCWSAASGKPGEWLMMDLNGKKRINAIQINFAELDQPRINPSDDYTAYIIYSSLDGKNWESLVDKCKNKRVNPHEFIVLDQPEDAVYIKIENMHAMNGGKFAIRDLRLFGHGYGQLPDKVELLEVQRNQEDERFAMLKWSRAEHADGYLVRFGITPDFMNQTIQIKGNETNSLMVHILTKGVKYYYRIDTYNGNGLIRGEMLAGPE
ncbi:MAG: family 43 glycosylhydrolase [Mangrovibacterium sp.]